MIAFIQSFSGLLEDSAPDIYVTGALFDAGQLLRVFNIPIDLTTVATATDFQALLTQAIIDFASQCGYQLTADALIGLFPTHADLAEQAAQIETLSASIATTTPTQPAPATTTQ